MPPKSVSATTTQIVGNDGKVRTTFQADYASAREKRFSELRSHAALQFTYDGLARPDIFLTGLEASLNDDQKLFIHPEDTADKGRILVADIDFKPGDIIFRERPLARASWNDFQCHECAEPHAYNKCRSFLGIYGKDSQLAKNMTQIEDLLCQYDIIGDLDRSRLFIKLIWLWSQCPEAQCWDELKKLTIAGTRQADYLQCVQEFRNKFLVKKSGLIPDSFSDEHLSTLLAVLNNNSHEIEGFGSGIWLYASLLEHSCQANCNFVTMQDELVLVAIAEIPTGTSLTIDYNVSTYKPYQTRQENYQSHYGFLCTCSMCTVGFDKPRAFMCPQSVRYTASFAQANQLTTFTMGQFDPVDHNGREIAPSSQQLNNQPGMLFHNQQRHHHNSNLPKQEFLQHLVDQNGNNIKADIQSYRNQFMASKFAVVDTNLGLQQRQPIHPITTMYSFDGVEITASQSPFLTTPPNPSATTTKCINGIVHPVGDGKNTTQWKCSGCGYTLTDAEVGICVDYEAKTQPPPSISQGDDHEDINDLFDMHNYSLPTLAEINAALSYCVLHVSHSSIYWTLYALALKWTKKATDTCYAIESSALKQKLNSTKSKQVAQKKAGKKGARGAATGSTKLHQIQLANPEDTINEDELNVAEYEQRKILNFFSAQYQPLTHTADYYQKQLSSQYQQQKDGMGDNGVSGTSTNLDLKAMGVVAISNNVELPLLCEHLWTLVAESATTNLHPLHPELLIIYDYLAQIQILKRRSKRAKYIWTYCYELSKIINSPIAKETYKLRRLVSHTPHTIAQLQHHYGSIDELYQKLQFHQEDEATTAILKQFSLTAIDSDSDDDLASLVDAMSGSVSSPQTNDPFQQQQQQRQQHVDNNGDDISDSDDDDEDLFLKSSFGKNIIKNAQTHQTNQKQTDSLHHQQGLISSPVRSNGPNSNNMGGNSMGMNSDTPVPNGNVFGGIVANPQPAKLQNSFGFSASVLFASPQKPTQQPQQQQSSLPGFNSFSVSSSGQAVFSSPPPQQQSTQSIAFGGSNGGFAAVSFGGNGFGSTPASPTTPNQQQQSNPFGAAPQANQHQASSTLPSNPFAGLNFNHDKK